MTGQITGFAVRYPVGWYCWDIGDGEARVDEIVAPVPDAELRATLRARILSTEVTMSAIPGSLWAGFWMPDITAWDVLAAARLTLQHPTPDCPTDRDAVLAERRADPLTGFTVFDRAVEPVDLPAGPGVVEVTQLAETRRGMFGRQVASKVELRVTYTIMPPCTGDSLQLEFITHRAEVLDQMAEHASAVAEEIVAVVEEEA